MGRGADIETLRALMSDPRPELALGTIKKLGAATDRSVLRVQIEVFPDQREVIARMTWSAVGTDSGDFEFPNVGDLVLLCFIDKNPDDAFVLTRLTSKEDTMPKMAMELHRVIKAKKKLFLNSPDAIHLTRGADGEEEGTENLVLGQVLKQFLSDELTELSTLSEKVGTLADKVSSVISEVQSVLSALSGPIGMSPGAAVIVPGTPIPASPALIAASTGGTAALSTIDTAVQQVSSDAGDVKSALDDLKSSPVEDEEILSDIAFTEKGSS